jgi:hypothetical protein
MFEGLDALFGGWGLFLYLSLEVHGKIYFEILIKKFSSPTEFFILSHQNGNPNPDHKMRGSGYNLHMDPQHCFSKIYFELCAKNVVMMFL